VITQFLLDFFHSIVEGLFSWLHDNLPSPPDFWSDASDGLSTVLDAIPGPVLHFVPLGAMIALALTVYGLVVGLGLLRLVRRGVSLVTGGGGMA